MKKIKLTGIFFIALAMGLTSCGKSEKTDSKAEMIFQMCVFSR